MVERKALQDFFAKAGLGVGSHNHDPLMEETGNVESLQAVPDEGPAFQLDVGFVDRWA
jgi:hypothetical protein